MHVARFGRKEQRGENLLHNGAHRRKRQSGGAAAHPLALDVRVSHGRQHDVMLPTRIRASLEVIEAERGKSRATARTAIGRSVSATRGRVRGRPRPTRVLGTTKRGRRTNTVRSEEIPSA